MIPTLLPVQGEAVKEIMILVGDYCSAKEIIIAVQEAVERIQISLSTQSDEDEEERKGPSLVVQLDILTALYSSCEFPFCTFFNTSHYQLCPSPPSIEPEK